MSKDIIVITPNGRRQKVHCTPDTSILQILEDVCQKQGFQASAYNLKHHNHILDLTTTVRFSNLPNKAMLEMVETERKREESNVTVGLLLEDGERRTADFCPHTSLYDLIISLAPTELNSLLHPTILYMRQEVTGVPALREKTLRHLGLIGGRAILRLLSKAEEPTQANVSAVYRRPQIDKEEIREKVDHEKPTSSPDDLPGPSNFKKLTSIDPIELIKKEKSKDTQHNKDQDIEALDTDVETSTSNDKEMLMKMEHNIKETPMDIDPGPSRNIPSSNTSLASQEDFERRLKIEEEVTFLGTQKAIAFMQPDTFRDELEDLPDDFYDLTIEEVRKLYNALQQHRLELENTPLLSSSKRRELQKQSLDQKIAAYKNVVVRIQFPDHIILQGVFSPNSTIEDVTNFIKEHLHNSEKPFHIFTTPLKETLDPKMTLLEAKFVPCVHMHFKWLEEEPGQPYLREEIYLKKTSSDAADILASKYRAPTRTKANETNISRSSNASSSTSNNSKLPKWFKK